MENSEITIREAIEYVDQFCPIKIIFNGIVLYNDYDSTIELEDGLCGEDKHPLDVIPNRIWQFDQYIVTSLRIEIVEFHHSIITMHGYFRGERI